MGTLLTIVCESSSKFLKSLGLATARTSTGNGSFSSPRVKQTKRPRLTTQRLQSVPGFSHFHVFARRKTPEEIDAAEAATVAIKKRGLKSDGGDKVPVINA